MKLNVFVFIRSKWFDHIANAVTNKGGPPERLTLKRVDDIINQTRVPYYNGTLGGDLDPERLAFIRDCRVVLICQQSEMQKDCVFASFRFWSWLVMPQRT